jgi:hypothetical protein
MGGFEMNESETIIINGVWYHIVDSPDDGGFYAEDEDFKTSEIYNTKEELLTDLRNGSIELSED